MSSTDSRELRQAFGTFMTGVIVVTALGEDDVPVGFTANSYTSVSLDPPLLLVCPAKTLSSFPVFNACRSFAVSVLAEDQQDISNIFATSRADRFAQVRWHPDAEGCPVIDGAAAAFSCAAHQRVEAGDHVILVGRITRFATSGGAGLGYANGGYFSLGLERRAQELASRAIRVGVILEHDGRVLMEETANGPRPLQINADGQGVLAAIESHLAAAGLTAVPGPVYSIFQSPATGEVITYYRGTAADGDARGLGRYVPVEEACALPMASEALADMMRRYALERRSGIFGLYVGDDDTGDVHLFGEQLPQ